MLSRLPMFAMRRNFIALVVLILAPSCSTQREAPKDLESTLILISFDGFRPIDMVYAPRLVQLGKEGVVADGLRPVFPTLTFPNHFTQVTGRYPEHHGIIANTMRDAQLGTFALGDAKSVDDGRWWQADPLWNTVQRQGRRSATMFWPGSSAEIKDLRPNEWLPFNHNYPRASRVERVLSWLDLPEGKRPTFVTLYFEDVDSAEHAHGPGSPEAIQAIKNVDQSLGQLLDGLHKRGLDDRVNIVVVSDHGMTSTSSRQVIALDKIIDLSKVDVTMTGAVAGLIPRAGTNPATLVSKLRRASPHMKVYLKNQIPARFHYSKHPRIPPIVILADEGWLVEKKRHSVGHGSHGYDNELASMLGIFVAKGPAFKKDYHTHVIDSIDVYELLAHVMLIQPLPNDGVYDRIRDVFAAPSITEGDTP